MPAEASAAHAKNVTITLYVFNTLRPVQYTTAYTKRQAVIVPRKRGDAYGFYQCYSSLTDSIVLSHFA